MRTLARRRDRPTRLSALKLFGLAWALTWVGIPPARADWLELRRRGVEAELAAARQASAPEPWIARYQAELSKDHPLAGLVLVVARAPAAQSPTGGEKDRGAPGAVMARFEGVAALRGVGVALQAGKVVVRLPGQKPQPASNAALFQDLPGVQLPLAVFVASELAALYTFQNEGEFDDVAVLRMRPRYERGPGLEALKVGVSKQWQAFVQSEVTDREGRPLGGLLWQEPQRQDKLVVWQRVRLRAKGSDAAVPLRLVELKRGKSAGKLAFDAKALR
jgi:hypothetical protein